MSPWWDMYLHTGGMFLHQGSVEVIVIHKEPGKMSTFGLGLEPNNKGKVSMRETKKRPTPLHFLVCFL